MSPAIHSFRPGTLRVLFFCLSLLHLAPAFGAALTPATRNALSSRREVLAKRVKQPFPSFPDTYDGRVQKGQYLKELLPLSPAQAQDFNGGVTVASPFQNSNEMLRWGWSPTPNPYPYMMSSHRPAFKDALDEAFKDPDYPVDPTLHIVYHALHDRPFRLAAGGLGQPTYGKYSNVVNPEAGAFIFDANFSPTWAKAEMGKGDVPDLYTVSDFGYFQWSDGCSAKSSDVKDLKVIFQSNVLNKKTFQIVVEALRKGGHQKIPTWDERITLSMDTEEGFAILGSVLGSSTAWMLIQHKEELGMKNIKEVVIWSSYSSFDLTGSSALKADQTHLNLRFTIEDA
ncbi:hypothetical protein CKAH01_04551 [Colletotrichum kahawae]|uniref:Tyrosinase copper-binding domain-containing protein n=1 Tax=Colletotrichum kahawae TaxID=34407 RepID=A0AAE0DAS0_COLKA|nr:hypothetical protein CKAH01_04551 [Colletotrichum kahawae]